MLKGNIESQLAGKSYVSIVDSLQQVTDNLRHNKKGLSSMEVESLVKQLDNIGAGKGYWSSKMPYSSSLSSDSPTFSLPYSSSFSSKPSGSPTFSLLKNDFTDFINRKYYYMNMRVTVCGNKLYILENKYYRSTILNISIEDLFTNYEDKISEIELHSHWLLHMCGGIAVDNSLNIIVVDTLRNAVSKFNSKSEKLAGTRSSTLSSPMGVAIDLLGKIFVCDRFNHRIQILSSDFKFLGEFGSKGDASNMFRYPSDVAFDRHGNIYIADSGNSCVKVFTPGLEPLRVIGNCSGETGELYEPVCLCINGDDFLYVADLALKMVVVYDCEGNFKGTFGQFIHPQSIAVDDKGHVYIIDISDESYFEKQAHLRIYYRTLHV